MRKIRFLVAGALCVLLASTGALVRDASGTTLLVQLPKTASAPRLLSMVSIAPETAELLGSFRAGTGAQMYAMMTVKRVPQVVFAHWLLSDGSRVSARSKLLRPANDGLLNTDLLPHGLALHGPGLVRAAYRMPAMAASAAPAAFQATAIGIGANSFTVEGLDLAPRDMAGMVTTEFIKGVRCYDKQGGFVLVETDPRIRAQLQAEIDLSQSRHADPATRMTNRWVKPTRHVAGSWSSDGRNATVTVRVFDSQGKVIASKTATGGVDRLMDMTTEVAAAVGGAMECASPKGAGWTLAFEVTVKAEGVETTRNAASVRKVTWKIDRKYSGNVELRRPGQRLVKGWSAGLSPASVPIDVSIQDEVVDSRRDGGEGDSWETTTVTSTLRGSGKGEVFGVGFWFHSDPDRRTYNIEIPLGVATNTQSRPVAFDVVERVEHTPYGYGPGPTHYTKVRPKAMLGVDKWKIPEIAGLLERSVIHHARDLPMNPSSGEVEFDSGALTSREQLSFYPFGQGPKGSDNVKVRIRYKLSSASAS